MKVAIVMCEQLIMTQSLIENPHHASVESAELFQVDLLSCFLKACDWAFCKEESKHACIQSEFDVTYFLLARQIDWQKSV